jgi:Holliday junction resolvase
MKGDTQERRLLEVFRELGFLAIRAPGSGTGDWEQPDVMAAQGGVTVAVELKAGSNPRNLKGDEVNALYRFADAYWAAALVGIRYKGDRTFYLADPHRLERTDAGRYSIPNSPERVPWTVAIPYGVYDCGDAAPDDPRFAGDDSPPEFVEWLDAVAHRQQGVDVCRGVIDTDGGGGA